MDLSAWTTGFGAVAPAYGLTEAQHGTVALAADKHTAQFQPAARFQGLASFAFTVTGSDGTSYTDHVAVLVSP